MKSSYDNKGKKQGINKLKMRLRHRIFSLFVLVCVFALISMSIASYITIKNISDYTARTSIDLGGGAAVKAGDALMEQAHEFLMVIAQQQSNNCDALLHSIQYDVELVAGVVSDIFNNPEYYPRSRPVIHSSEVTPGTYANTFSLKDTIPMTESIQRELDLLSNLNLLTPILLQNDNIVGIYVGMESGLFYNYTATLYDTSGYDPRTRPWYVKAVAHPGEVILTDVYEDSFGLGLVITAAKAVYDDDGNLLGVVAFDILLESLKKLILETNIIESGYAFILSGDGEYIVHPGMGTQGFYADAPESERGFDEVRMRMIAGETGFVRVEEGEPFFVAFVPIPATSWSLGVTVYENELLSGLNPLTERMTSLIDAAEKDIAAMSEQAIVTFIIISIVVAVMLILLSVALAAIISKPIQKLTAEVVRVGAGDLDARIEGSFNDELDKVRDAVNAMAADIKTYMKDKLEAERVAHETKIEKLELLVKVHYDSLTGVYNRRYLDENLDRLIQSLSRMGAAISILMIDIDEFKKYNDTYGHGQGDECLESIAKTLSAVLSRKDDFLARYGGEEFVAVLSNTDEKGACVVAEKMLKSVRELKLPHKKNKAADYVTISIGITTGAAEHTRSGGEYVKRADEALYISKQNGRNRCTYIGF